MIVDPGTQKTISQVDLPSTPVFIQTSGEYDLDWSLLVSCRDSKVYTIYHDTHMNKVAVKPNVIELECQPIALSLIEKQNVFVATMDSQVHCFNMQGVITSSHIYILILT